jgi:hypothetical protein
MRITIEPTQKIVTLNGVPARIWAGTTDTGTRCLLFVTRIAVEENEPAEAHQEFAEQLSETPKPHPEAEALPARLIL